MTNMLSSYHLSPYNDITLLFLYSRISYLWLIYFSIVSLYLLIFLTYFSHPPTPPLWQSPVCSLYVWLFLFYYVSSFVCLFQIPHTSEIIQYLSFSVWLISVNKVPSRSIHVVANGKILFLFVPLCVGVCVCVCVCICIPHLLYPFIYWCALRLLPYLGYCK